MKKNKIKFYYLSTHAELYIQPVMPNGSYGTCEFDNGKAVIRVHDNAMWLNTLLHELIEMALMERGLAYENGDSASEALYIMNHGDFNSLITTAANGLIQILPQLPAKKKKELGLKNTKEEE